MFTIATALDFLEINIDDFKRPYEKRPLAMSAEEVLAIDLFMLNVLRSRLDREGGQNHGIAFSYNSCEVPFCGWIASSWYFPGLPSSP